MSVLVHFDSRGVLGEAVHAAGIAAIMRGCREGHSALAYTG